MSLNVFFLLVVEIANVWIWVKPKLSVANPNANSNADSFNVGIQVIFQCSLSLDILKVARRVIFQLIFRVGFENLTQTVWIKLV